jgi:peptidyl-prolyl cis-trans isomerase SurA
LTLNPHPFRRRVSWLAAVLALAVLGLGFTGCNKKEAGADVMAEVNGKKVLRSDVDRFYRIQMGAVADQQKPSAEQEASMRLSILDILIQRQIELQRAEKLGLVTNDDEVDSKLNEMKAAYTTEDKFIEDLKKQGQTVDELKHDIRDNLTITKLLNKEVNSKISISDADLNAYYQAHKAEFNRVEPGYDLAQVLVYVQPPPGMPRPDEPDPRRRIQMIYNRLQSGEDFSQVAARFSEHADTANSGGRMGIVSESAVKSMDPATREAILKLKPGEMTGIIPVQVAPSAPPAGYRIVKLLGKEPAGQRDLSDPRVQQWIRDQIKRGREQLLTAAFREVIRNDAKVENYFAQEVMKNAK